jgi:hypothetical protein
MNRSRLFGQLAMMVIPAAMDYDELNPPLHARSTVLPERSRFDWKLSNVESVAVDPRVELYRQEREARKLASYLKRNPNPPNPESSAAAKPSDA